MTLALFLSAALVAAWGFLAFAITESHPTPSQTSLLGHVLVAVIATPLLLVAAFLSWLFGG